MSVLACWAKYLAESTAVPKAQPQRTAIITVQSYFCNIVHSNETENKETQNNKTVVASIVQHNQRNVEKRGKKENTK